MHLQDVTRLHEGKPDMCDGAVNWTKMRQVAKHCEVTIGCTKYSDVERPAVTACSDILDLPVYNLDDDVSCTGVQVHEARLTQRPWSAGTIRPLIYV